MTTVGQLVAEASVSVVRSQQNLWMDQTEQEQENDAEGMGSAWQ